MARQNDMTRQGVRVPSGARVLPSWNAVSASIEDEVSTPILMRRTGSAAAEVLALRRAGLVRPLIADVHVPIFTREDTPLRVSALALILPPPRSAADVVVGYETARWVLAGGPVPERIDVYAVPGRSRKRFRDCRIREAPLAPGMVTVLGGLSATISIALTVPPRTAVDLARSLPREQALVELDLLAGCGLTAAAVTSMLGRMSRLRGIPRARDTLRHWDPEQRRGPK
jgi:hypothetical protein